MKILDCTLRDGGFRSDFNWDIGFAQRYFAQMSKFNIHYIELGYWKQTSKSKNRFYNLGIKDVDLITKDAKKNNACIIIDYHYCSKDLKSYPKKNETPISMIRITARREDLDEAIRFANKLQEKTQLDLSFQIINSTNYSKVELSEVAKKFKNSNFLYLYFADSHGNLNLMEDYWKFEDAINTMRENNFFTGFHLHNHTDRALLNYHYAKNKNVSMTDTSIRGLGKGGGNLKLENVIINENLLELLSFMKKEKKHLYLDDTNQLYFILSGRLGITDNYAKVAIQKDLSLEQFYEAAYKLRGVDKDTYNKDILD
jgi:4-hydroxy 2-oxovalerate aldolase